MRHDEIFLQFPLQTTNISILQSNGPDQMVNYAPIVHTIPTQTESYIYDVDSATPLLLLTPSTPPNGAQAAAIDGQANDSSVGVSPNGSFFNEVSVNHFFFFVFNRMVCQKNPKSLCTLRENTTAAQSRRKKQLFPSLFPTFKSFTSSLNE